MRKRMPFYLSLASLAGFFGIFIHVQYILPLTTKKKIDLTKWEEQVPLPVQVATGLGLLAFLSMTWMLWPGYHLASPIMVFVVWAGVLSFISLF
jgi:hypothetical protein